MPTNPIRFDEFFRRDQMEAARRAMFDETDAREERDATFARTVAMIFAVAFLVDIALTLSSAGHRTAAMEAYRSATTIAGS